ncbi:MAG: NAD(P)/FAD-dependent oxidoreductase [Thermoleophilaceae bacterium]
MSDPGGRIAIVGGGPAGLSTARSYRDAGGTAPVTIFAGEPHAPYERPPLTKELLRGETTADELSIEADSFFAERGIELRTGVRVSGIDPERRRVVTAAGEEVPFAACVIATGSEPQRLPVPGGEDPCVVLVREIETSHRLREVGAPGRRVTVIGSGFIGCEAAVSLSMVGASVTLVSDEEVPQAGRLGEEVGSELASWLAEEGVDARMGAAVEGIEPAAGGLAVTVAGGDRVEADLVLCAVGVAGRTDLAERAGLGLELGGVAVDSAMATSVPGLYAVGDVASALNSAAGRRLRVEHWGDALAHGEVAGRALAGEEARWDSAPGFWSVIGGRTLKYCAWDDGWDEVRFDRDDDGSFTAWYGYEGTCVGVLTHGHDEDYERAPDMVEQGRPLP